MKINKAYRYELDPNVNQRICLAQHVGCARFAYNWGLGLRIELYETTKKSTNAVEQHRLLNAKKATDFPWMYEVSKCAPQEALRDLDRAFGNFFRGLKEGKKIGFPTPKRRGVHDSCRLTGSIKVNERSIQLPRLGILRTKERTKVKGRILSATIIREADRWFVSLTVEVEIDTPKPVQGMPIGIDLGLSSFITTSEGEKILPPKPLNKALKRLKRLSKQHSKKQKGSKNKRKSALKLARHHRKIRNQRSDFLHKLSTKLAKTKPVIIMETLNVQELLQKKQLSRHIADVGWSRFTHMLEYKTKWYGSTLVQAPVRFASTKVCSACHCKKDSIHLHEREWTCPYCHAKHDRDVNAAINLLQYYTESSSGIYACEDSSGGISEKLISYGSLKQEVMSGIIVHKL